MRHAALEYAARGMPVFPVWGVTSDGRCRCGVAACKDIGKHPLARLAPNGFKNATNDEAQIRAWWEQAPDANIGTPTETRFVLDADPRHAGDETLAELERQHGALPLTPLVHTGGGGAQYHFAMPTPPLGNSAAKLGPGLDTRGVGGYVLLPPSRHKSGQRYCEDPDRPLFETPLAPVPAWMLVMLAGPTASPNGGPATEVTDWAALLAGAPEGERHAVATRIAGHYLGKGLPRAEVEQILIGYSMRCTPAFPSVEARRIVHDLAEKDRRAADRSGDPRAEGVCSAARADLPASRPRTDDSTGVGLPTIETTGDLAATTAAAWRAVQAANAPVYLFRHGTVPSRLERDDADMPVVRALTPDRMRHVLARVARFVTVEHTRTGPRSVDIYPPLAVVRDVLACPEPPLPILERIVEVPVLTRTGQIRTTLGYDPNGHVIYAPPAGLAIPPVPECPTPADIADACRLLNEELLGDFPFIGLPERVHALGLLLQPFVREFIEGPTPLHLFEKSTPGTGATLLVDVLLTPALGRPVPTMTEGKDEDEWRKRVTAKLFSGSPIIHIDNLRNRLDSAAVSAALTAGVWEDRILGRTEVIRVPVRCAWIATGNNPAVSQEIARRSVRSRLDAQTDEPWRRTGFRHPDLPAWALSHRGDLIAAALTLGRAWVAAGCPNGSASLGMFESWSKVMGGIFAVSGLNGFLGNLDDFYSTADQEAAEQRGFIAAWWAAHGDGKVTTAQLVEVESLPGRVTTKDVKDDRARATRLGRLLGTLRDRHYRINTQNVDIMVRVDRPEERSHNAQVWRLVRVTETAQRRGR